MTSPGLPYVQPEIYDAVYAWYRDDLDYYVAAARAAGGPVLEVACGTGRILVPTLAAGVDIEGLDVSPAMLDVLRRSAAARGLTARVHEADMRDFTMPRRYALITIPFRSFQHLESTDDQIRALRCIRDHLESGGALRFNVFHVSFESIVDPFGQAHRDRTVEHPETGYTLRLHTRKIEIDRVHQLMHVEREVHESDASGAVTVVHAHGFTMRWVYKAETELLLRAAGFTRFEVRGGFDGRPLERDTDEMVWTAWRD